MACTGSHESLLAASSYVKIVEERQGLKLGCPEEISWRKGLISDEQLIELSKPLFKSGYGNYLIEKLNLTSNPNYLIYGILKSKLKQRKFNSGPLIVKPKIFLMIEDIFLRVGTTQNLIK